MSLLSWPGHVSVAVPDPSVEDNHRCQIVRIVNGVDRIKGPDSRACRSRLG
jgi:hypothetical protein